MNFINIVEVQASHHKRDFIGLAKWLYRDEPRWIAPLESSIEAIFSPQLNPLFQSGGARRWLVYNRRGVCIGRIAAFYSHKVCEDEKLRVGGCGFFESIDSQRVADLLFDTARYWLISQGFNAMDAPINFGSREAWWGLLTKGFEYEPLFENNYNLPYYSHLFERYGFRCYFNQYSYLWRVGIESANPQLEGRSARLLSRGDYSVRSIRRGELKRALGWFQTIYNSAWSRFPGIEPLSESGVERLFKSLHSIVDYDLLYFAFYRGEAVGFFIMVPDINTLIRDFGGRLTLWHRLKFWWRLRAMRSCDRIFGVVFGVAPEHQGRGVESAIITSLRDEFILTKRNRCYRSLEFAWIGDFNPVMNKMLERYVGAVPHKQHTTYRIIFDTSIEFERHPIISHK